jgi:hypothetical protein
MPDPELSDGELTYVIVDLRDRKVIIKTSDAMRTLGDMRFALHYHFGVPPHHIKLSCCGHLFGNTFPNNKKLTDLFPTTLGCEQPYECLITLLWLEDEDFIMRVPTYNGRFSFELVKKEEMKDQLEEWAQRPDATTSHMTIGQFKQFEEYANREYRYFMETNREAKEEEIRIDNTK